MTKKAVDPSYFDEDYYQRGIETGKSCYTNYRWLPELTMPMVMRIIDYLHIRPKQSILDYGCALGFVVKAFRLLHRDAWGYDISPWAIEHVDQEVKKYCFLSRETIPTEIPEEYDFCIAKDVLEHMDYNCIENMLRHLPAKNILAIIPLGKDGKYESPYNDLDKSHIICEGMDWWHTIFHSSGWRMVNFAYRIDGIKENHYKLYPKSHGFFWCEK